jgi:hypothetical protein
MVITDQAAAGCAKAASNIGFNAAITHSGIHTPAGRRSISQRFPGANALPTSTVLS